MQSTETTLCLVNTTGKDITNITVTVDHNHDWDGDFHPDRNFRGATIPNNDSRCERQDLNGFPGSAWYKMTLQFSDGCDLTFRNDQRDAQKKLERFYPVKGSAADDLTLYQTSGGYTNALYIRTRAEPDNTCWMRELLNRKPFVRLDEFTMPGSHDAGMYTTVKRCSVVKPEWVLTQSDNINRQLRCGSRYFDLRVYYDGLNYRIGHFAKMQIIGKQGRYGPTLSDVLGQVKAYIQSREGQSETVILKFSHTMDASPYVYPIDKVVAEVINQVKTDLSECLYISTNPGINLSKIPLRELAGKIIAVFDIEYQPHWDVRAGICPYRDYPTTEYGALKVFDQFSDTDSYPAMSADQLQKLEKYGGYGNDYLSLLSWTLTRKGILKIKDIQVLSTLARPWLPQILTKIRGGKLPNIVYYDYADPYINRAIINLNA